MKSFMVCTHRQILWYDQIKRNEKGSAHVVIWRSEEVHTGFWLDNPDGTDHTEHLGVDERAILKRILKKWNGVRVE